MTKKHAQQIEKEIAGLREDYGAAVLNACWTREMSERVRDTLVSRGLNEISFIRDIHTNCIKWGKQKNPKISLAGVVPPEDVEMLEGLIKVFSPKTFAELLARFQGEEAQLDLNESMEHIFRMLKNSEANYVIKQTAAAAGNTLPKYAKLTNNKIKDQLHELIKTYGPEAVAQTAQNLRDKEICEKIQHMVDQVHIHGGHVYPDAIAEVQQKFSNKKSYQKTANGGRT